MSTETTPAAPKVMTGNDTAQQFDKVSQIIRGAIIASLPCAFEQFITISIPGQIIDTTPGKAYVPSARPSSGELHKIRVNEARLVDSMIPLDTMMLGPTGKSVSRSYLAALDYLVPSETELTLSLNKDQDNQPPTKYGAAMRYLRKPVVGPVGMPTRTPVDIYVEKQALFTFAQSKWDAIQDKNAADLETNPDEMTAEEMEKRTTWMRMAKYELQARWMDWVVNGDKILDHNFEAVRASNILDLVDGTQWAQVKLEPQHWATLCKEKTDSWVENNPVSAAVLQREIDRLNLLLAAYGGFKDWNDTNITEDQGTPAETAESAQYSKETYLNVYRAEEDLKKANVEIPKNDTTIATVKEKYKNAVIALDAMIKADTAQ
ncbi:uncharacterized protein LAJ45_09894 [Morchella importuna]|uniref:uncharacterized protein n=1 Tax=Morchella importuna TaxID=1174673 RepID=UPI001E8D67C9|nr:uncharacterized protein LAJ45_09894 [Morchella importuna]KAH8145972.1 hypothetical protein LAJ45_09894 [Morchella importuna]